VRSAASIFLLLSQNTSRQQAVRLQNKYNFKFAVDVELAHVRSAASIFLLLSQNTSRQQAVRLQHTYIILNVL